MKVVRLGKGAWGVIEPGKDYAGHIFPTRWQARAYAEGAGH
jgi:hypothetical protein